MHKFHIPVMGTGFTIDTPIQVAPMGIRSVISLVDDVLIEQMRAYYCSKFSLPYTEIKDKDEDSRAKKITAYMDLVGEIVKNKFNDLKKQTFVKGSDLYSYFNMLPDGSLRNKFLQLMKLDDNDEARTSLEYELMASMRSGAIEVNIMTKLHRERFKDGEKMPVEYSDALAALRGAAKSKTPLNMVFSAGMNAHLYSYVAEFADFLPGSSTQAPKKIILKVSDYRSALVQGRFLAKKGVWVSEYRIESGLNCGGHAFATRGFLLGPALKEFQIKRKELQSTLAEIFVKTLKKKDIKLPENTDLNFLVTAQGGVGTGEEQQFLLEDLGVDSVGWGSPFLLVPEAVRVDEPHLIKLEKSQVGDVQLSDSSPLGIKFWNLVESASELAKLAKVTSGKPGADCPKGFVRLNSDFTKKPICRSSKGYMNLRKKEIIADTTLRQEQKDFYIKEFASRACICHDLAGVATQILGISTDAIPAICCGPNIVNFKKRTTLEQMVHHIYGRPSDVILDKTRDNFLIAELKLYQTHFIKELEELHLKIKGQVQGYFEEYKANLMEGIGFYQDLFSTTQKFSLIRESALKSLIEIKSQINAVNIEDFFPPKPVTA